MRRLAPLLLAGLAASAFPASGEEPAPVIPAGQRMAMARLLVPDDFWLSVHLRLPEVNLLGDGALKETFEARQNPRFRSPYSWTDLAVNFILRNQWDPALRCVLAAQDAAEPEASLDLLRAWLTEMSGNWPLAMSLYERQTVEHPADKVPRHRMTCCAIKLYQTEYALRLLAEQMERDPGSPELFHLRGLVHILLGDYPSAMLDLRRAHEIAGDIVHPETLAAMALCEMMQNNTNEACGWFSMAWRRAAPRLRLLLTGRAEWNPLRGSETWKLMLANHSIPDHPDGVPEELLSSALCEGAIAYRDKYRIPPALRVELRLRRFEPYTAYRTLRDKVNFDAETGRFGPAPEPE